MVKVSTRRRKKAEPDANDVYGRMDAWAQSIGADNPDNPANKPEQDNKGPSMETLLAEIAGLKARLDDRSSLDAVLTTPVQTNQTPAAPPELKPDNMPDPAMDADAYQAELNRRIAQNHKDRANWDNARRNDMQQLQARQDALFSDFSEAYPDYADLPERQLKYATDAVVDRLQARGIDIG